MNANIPAPSERTDNSWMECMRRGDFVGAWQICDDVLRSGRDQTCWHLPRHEQYIWSGTPLHGQRVLVRCYHGLGDTVQFLRFTPLLKAIAREVIVWVQPALLPLLHSAPGIDRLLPLHEGTPEIEYDVDVESMELAHIFRITPESLGRFVPYLHAPQTIPAKNTRRWLLRTNAAFPGASVTASPRSWATQGSTCAPAISPEVGAGTGLTNTPSKSLQPRPGGIRHIGIVWSAGAWRPSRSIPLHFLAPLMNLPDVCLHVLQRGPACRAWPVGIGVQDGSDNIEDTARLMHKLDCIVTVDSFPAHLAGALSVPVWTLLEHQPDWRWMLERDDTPWYPTMRLFRQPSPGDWGSVIAQVCDRLAETAGQSL